MDLGRQRTYTGIRPLPIEEQVKEKLLFTLDSRAENFRAIDVMVFEVAGPTMTKNDDRVENGRKKAAKNNVQKRQLLTTTTYIILFVYSILCILPSFTHFFTDSPTFLNYYTIRLSYA